MVSVAAPFGRMDGCSRRVCRSSSIADAPPAPPPAVDGAEDAGFDADADVNADVDADAKAEYAPHLSEFPYDDHAALPQRGGCYGGHGGDGGGAYTHLPHLLPATRTAYSEDIYAEEHGSISGRFRTGVRTLAKRLATSLGRIVRHDGEDHHPHGCHHCPTCGGCSAGGAGGEAASAMYRSQ
eukprot:2243-Chlamydomonas_euryale.AAC.1